MIKILPVKHTMFAALHLVEQLKKLGVESVIVDHVEVRDKSIYIIYNASAVSVLPKNYIVMQTEIYFSHWFNKRYLNTIKNAICVWDYSECNTHRYRAYNKNIAIVSPGVIQQPSQEKDIPVLFYGWISGSDRRHEIVYKVFDHFRMRVEICTLGQDMWDILSRAKVVLNVHYHDNSPLELFRINEALSFNCHVVSEGYCVRYPMVRFGKTVDDLIENIRHVIDAEFNSDLSGLDNLEEIEKGLKMLGLKSKLI